MKTIRWKLRCKTCNDEEKRLLVEDLAYHQCTWPEIATILGKTRQYVEETYRDVLNSAQSNFRHDLRRLQVGSATDNKGSTTMLIWLGKQYLEQSDSPQMEMKKDQFDEFIAWISLQKTQLLPPVQNKSIAS